MRAPSDRSHATGGLIGRLPPAIWLSQSHSVYLLPRASW